MIKSTVLSENPGSSFGTCMVTQNSLHPVPGNPMSFSGLKGWLDMCVVSRHPCRHSTHTHRIKINKPFLKGTKADYVTETFKAIRT